MYINKWLRMKITDIKRWFRMRDNRIITYGETYPRYRSPLDMGKVSFVISVLSLSILVFYILIQTYKD